MNFPDLSSESLISVDIETWDPLLKEKGNGVYRKDGYLAGFSLATPGGFREYYDVAHEDKPQRSDTLAYLKDVMSTPCPKIGANILYDFDWIQNGYDIPVNGPWWDVQIAASLIDENRDSFSLDDLSYDYLGDRKHEDGLHSWAREHGIKDPKKYIAKMPYSVVRPYGIKDADLSLRLWERMHPILINQGLENLFFETESKLLPLLLRMRSNGVRIDVNRLDELISIAERQIPEKEKELKRIAGRNLNPNSFKQKHEWFTSAGLEIPTVETKKKNEKTGAWEWIEKESYSESALEDYNHPIAHVLLDLIKAKKMYGTFLTKNIADMICPDGRIHASINPVRGEDGGTVTGRFSYYKPNLQQLPNPKKDPFWGRAIRSLYLPEPGQLWNKKDYASVEPRVFAHYAVGVGSEMFRDRYNEDALWDVYNYVGGLSDGDEYNPKTRRGVMKIVFLAFLYERGYKALGIQLGIPTNEAKALKDRMSSAVPALRETSNRVQETMKRQGYIRNLNGRRRRITDRNLAYKSLNSLIQGSATDIIKVSMVKAWESGVCDILTPLIQVHDEWDNSMPDTDIGREASAELSRVMETAFKLKVPLVVESEYGPNWADVK